MNLFQFNLFSLPSHADLTCPLHTLLSLFLLILCLPNVPPPLQYSHTHAHSNTPRPFSSASLSECDWLITTQKAWLCWCQKQDRYPRPQGGTEKIDVSLFHNPPFFSFTSSFHLHLYCEPLTLSHMHTHWPPLITVGVFIAFIAEMLLVFFSHSWSQCLSK